MGQVKLRRYGNLFLDEILSYLSMNDENRFDRHEYDDVRRDSGPYAKMGAKWTEEDEQILLREFQNGKSIAELSTLLQRREGGIRSRLMKLRLIESEDDSR
jgi:hypothetical protein